MCNNNAFIKALNVNVVQGRVPTHSTGVDLAEAPVASMHSSSSIETESELHLFGRELNTSVFDRKYTVISSFFF